MLSLAVENVEPTHTPYPEIRWEAGRGNGVVWAYYDEWAIIGSFTSVGRQNDPVNQLSSGNLGWDKNVDLEDLVVPECLDPAGYVDIVFAWREGTNPPEVIQIGVVDYRDSFMFMGVVTRCNCGLGACRFCFGEWRV